MTDFDRSRLEYHVVDVFTDRPFAGNPLAVVLGGESLTTEQMQTLAGQFRLSETAFPLFPPDVDRADYQLRIFTPEVELPFAGHPSVGTAWLLRSLGRISAGTALQSCGAGVLALQVTEASATVSGGEPILADVVDQDTAIAAVGLDASDLIGLPLKVASVGLPYVVLPVKWSALSRCEGDSRLLRGFFGLPERTHRRIRRRMGGRRDERECSDVCQRHWHSRGPGNWFCGVGAWRLPRRARIDPQWRNHDQRLARRGYGATVGVAR